MNTWIAIISKNNLLEEQFLNSIDRNSSSLIPSDYTQKDYLISPSKCSGLWAWGRKKKDDLGNPLIVKQGNLAGSLVGYVSDRGKGEYSQVLKRFIKEDSHTIFANLGGVYAASIYNPQADNFDFFNTITRSVPIIYTENYNYIVVGTRQLLVNMIANKFRSPDYNLTGMVSYLFNAHYINDETPFKNVFVLPMNSHLRVTKEGLKILEIDSTSQYLGMGRDRSGSSEYYDEMADILCHSVKVFQQTGKTYQLGLSGGKDSRVIAAVLKNQSIDFFAYTKGYEEDPEVVIAKKIAETLHISLGLNIAVSETKPYYKVNIYQQMCQDLFRYDGTNINLPVRPTEYIKTNPEISGTIASIKFSGVGGECLRGGYAIYSRSYAAGKLELTPKEVKAILDQFTQPQREDIVLPEFFQVYQTNLRDWLNANYYERFPSAILDLKYLTHSEGMRNSFCCSAGDITPLADNQLIKYAHQLLLRNRIEDKPHFEMIRRLAPEILDIPIAGDRWSFEAYQPLPGDEEAWHKRTPLQFPSLNLNYPYYLVGTDMREEFRQVILDGEGKDLLFSLIDRSKVEQIFYTRKIYEWVNSWLLWHIYALSTVLSNDWFEIPRYRESETLHIRHTVAWHSLSLDLLKIVRDLELKSESLSQKTKTIQFGSSEKDKIKQSPSQVVQLISQKSIKAAFKQTKIFLKSLLKLNYSEQKKSNSYKDENNNNFEKKNFKFYQKKNILRFVIPELQENISALESKYKVPPEQWREFTQNFSLKPILNVGNIKIVTLADLLNNKISNDEQTLFQLCHFTNDDSLELIKGWVESIQQNLYVYEGE